MLRALNPWVIGGAFAAGLALGTTAGVIGYDKLILPGRLADAARNATEKAVLQCTVTQYASSRAATEAVQRRTAEAVDKALEDFRKASTASEAARVAQIDRMEQEIADYERRLETEGRTCPLTDADIEFLRND